MGKVTNLKAAASPQRSQARRDLAEAIEARDAVERELEANAGARLKVRDQVYDLEADIDRSAESIEAAKSAWAEYCTDVAMGSDLPAPRPIEEVRTAARTVIDKRDAAQGALDALVARSRELESLQRFRKSDVRDRARAVVTDELDADALVAKFRSVWVDFVTLRKTIEFLGTNFGGMVPESHRGALSELQIRWSEAPCEKPWREALAALETDADAPLPRI